VSSLYHTNASPIHQYKRDNNKTNKNNNNKFKPTANNDTSSQLPVSDKDAAEFRLWTKFANAAYCNVTDWKCGAACETEETKDTRLIKFFQNSVPRDNNAYVAINDKEKAIVVAFRGTANVKSFLNDLEFLQVPFFDKSNNAKVHSGFLATYNDTRTEITNLVKKLVAENPDYKVVTTGHSLGGSLAVFQTLDLIGTPGLNPSNLLTYTYGEPRTGDKNFAALVEKTGFSFFRVVNKADIVPHLPPQQFKYIHHSAQFWIRPDNNKIVKCQDPEDKTCANSEKFPSINLINHAKYFDTLFLLTCLKK